MGPVVLAMAFLAFAGAPALAQSAPPDAAKAARPKYTLETPIHTLMEDPRTLAFLDKHFPGLSERMMDPEIGTIFAGVSIQGLSIDPDHGRALTPAVMAKLAVALEAAQAEPAPAP